MLLTVLKIPFILWWFLQQSWCYELWTFLYILLLVRPCRLWLDQHPFSFWGMSQWGTWGQVRED